MQLTCEEIKNPSSIDAWRWHVIDRDTNTVFGRGADSEDAWKNAADWFYEKLRCVYRDLHNTVGDMT